MQQPGSLLTDLGVRCRYRANCGCQVACKGLGSAAIDGQLEHRACFRTLLFRSGCGGLFFGARYARSSNPSDANIHRRCRCTLLDGHTDNGHWSYPSRLRVCPLATRFELLACGGRVLMTSEIEFWQWIPDAARARRSQSAKAAPEYVASCCPSSAAPRSPRAPHPKQFVAPVGAATPRELAANFSNRPQPPPRATREVHQLHPN